jgi:hypothetical protein
VDNNKNVGWIQKGYVCSVHMRTPIGSSRSLRVKAHGALIYDL